MVAGRHLISRLTPLASIPRFSLIAASRSSSSIHLRPLAAAGDAIVRRLISTSANGGGLRCFSTRPTVSSLNDPSPNFSNRPPKETILLDGCDFEHWLVVVDPPDPNLTRDEIIDSYIKTLAQVVGSEDEARMKIYSVSTKHYFAFGALVSEELSYKIKTLPKVRWVLPDSYLDVKNKDYGGEPFIDGKAVPYDPKYHEEWVRNNARANERSRRNDRPRNADRSRNFERRRENMQQNQSFQSREAPPMQNQPYQNNPNAPPQNTSPPQNFASRDAPPMANQSYQTNPFSGPPNPDFNANRNIPPQNVSPPQNFASRDAPPMPNQSYQTNPIPGPPNPDFNANRNVPPPPPQLNPAYPNPMPNPSYQGGGGPNYQGYTGGPTPYQGGNQGYQGGSPVGGTGYQGSGPVYQGGSGGPPPYQGSYQGGNPGYQGSNPGYQGGNPPNYRPAGYQGPGSDHQAGGPGGAADYQGRDVQGRDY